MTDTPGEQLTEEPQSERGPMGSRDTGSDQPSAGPAGRPAGRADDGEDSTVDPQEAQHGGPDLPTGDGGG
jgi:hypothetical protein